MQRLRTRKTRQKRPLRRAVRARFASYALWNKPGHWTRPPAPYDGKPTIKEEHVPTLEPLLRRYSQIRHDYLTGRCGGPELDFRVASEGLVAAARALEAEARVYVEGLRAAGANPSP